MLAVARCHERGGVRGQFSTAGVALGWVAVIAMPQLVRGLPVWPLALLALGGLLYSAGAVVYARKRPDPWPRVFGFHELFLAFVIAAAIAHAVAIGGWIIPQAG